MHKAIAFYEGTIREYQNLHKSLRKNTLNENSDQWVYWKRLAPKYRYAPTAQGVQALRTDLIAAEMI